MAEPKGSAGGANESTHEFEGGLMYKHTENAKNGVEAVNPLDLNCLSTGLRYAACVLLEVSGVHRSPRPPPVLISHDDDESVRGCFWTTRELLQQSIPSQFLL